MQLSDITEQFKGVGFSQLGSLHAAKMLYDDNSAALEVTRTKALGVVFSYLSLGRHLN